MEMKLTGILSTSVMSLDVKSSEHGIVVAPGEGRLLLDAQPEHTQSHLFGGDAGGVHRGSLEQLLPMV